MELDLQLTKDNVVVISHDIDTTRVFTRAVDISQSDFEDIKDLKTKSEPHESIASFKQLLSWLLKNDVQVMLDIKRVNREEIFNEIEKNLIEFGVGSSEKEKLHFWSDKLIIGLWNKTQYEYLIKHQLFQNFDKIIISFLLKNILQLLEFSDEQTVADQLTGVSLLHIVTWDLTNADFKYLFDNYIKNSKVKLYFWTVNDQNDMNWILNFPYVHGIITDSPDTLHDLLSNYQDIPNDDQYLPNKLKQLEKLKNIDLRAKLRRAFLFRAYNFVLFLFRYKVLDLKVFGYDLRNVYVRVSKAIGLI